MSNALALPAAGILRHSHNTSYTIRQDEKDWSLQETTEEKDLGVITTADLKVSQQCCEAASKANRILGMVNRQFKNLDKNGFLILYKGFVRPLRICHPVLVTVPKRRH